MMNLHEYQGKEILKSFGVTVQDGIVAESKEQAVEAARTLKELYGSDIVVIKAQIHAGGRGKGGGVKVAKNSEEVREKAGQIIGMQLVTPQTGPQGKKVHKVLIARDMYYPGPSKPREFYMSILLDRAKSRNVVVYSTEGGMDIEEVAEKHPEKIWKEEIDPKIGLRSWQARKIAFRLGLEGNAFREMIRFVENLYRAYVSVDASLFEINPLLKTSDEKIVAVDAKVTLDDNSLFRHPDLEKLRDLTEENPADLEAKAAGLNYIKLDGNIGCMVNGAGLAMATMDLIKLSGGEPANFLDVGGTANAERVAKAFQILLRDPNVKAILVNIFGGIVRCDRVAQGIADAYRSIGDFPVPLIVRLQGTNASEARELLDKSGIKVKTATEFHEVAKILSQFTKN